MIFFKLTGITVICVMALKIVLSEGMPLERLGNWLEEKAKSNKWYDAFICPWCTGLQSITAHLFAFGLGFMPLVFDLHFFLRWLLVIMTSSFISGNLWNLYETVNRIKEKNEVEKEFLISANTVADILIESNVEEYFEEHHGEQIVFDSKNN